MIYNLLSLLMYVGLGTGLLGIYEAYKCKEKEANKLFRITSYIMILFTVLITVLSFLV